VRYGSISLALLCLFASNSFAALEVINPEEERRLTQIEDQFDIDALLISVNNKFTQHNKKAFDIEELVEKIESEKLSYDMLITDLPKKILAKDNLPQVYKQIESTVNKIDQLETRSIQESAALEAENTEILAEYNAINSKRTEQSKQLFKLKTDITNRLIGDLSKSSSSLPVNINGSTECSKYQSITECLKESKSFILTNTRNESPFLNDKSVLLSYEVVDANMNMNGNLNYKVAMKFKPSYNNKIDQLLNERLGLSSAMITLVSNVPADWFINGVKIGTGKELFHEIPLGKHGILASYQSKDKSSVENIEGNGVFNYTFDSSGSTLRKSNNTESPGVAAESPKGEIKQKSKAKYTLMADQTSIKETKEPEEKKSLSERGYEYFMGVTPSNKKQNFEFTNEPVEK
jgi:hypothetical protein